MRVRALLGTLAVLSACASVPVAEEELLFRAEGEGFEFEIRAPNTITVEAGGRRLTFTEPVKRYPRWSGTDYQAAENGHRIWVRIRDDRPCRSERRSASVELELNGEAFTGCGLHLPQSGG